MSLSSQGQCPTCGASVTFEEPVVADLCVFCTSPLVRSQVAGGVTPDAIAPFLVPKQAAADRLATHLAGHWLAPPEVRRAEAPDKLHGVLVPFWAHEARARSRWSARVGVYWYRTETYTVTVQRNGRSVTETRTRVVQETEWFPTSGTHASSFVDHLVSGSRGLPEAESNALEPFDLGGARPYDAALLAGWVAEAPTVQSNEARAVADAEIRRLEAGRVTAFLPGDVAQNVHVDSEVTVDAVRSVLLPVWIATYRWKGEVHRMLVNGQTGEVVGTVPKSVGRIVAAVVGGTFAVALVVAIAVAIGEVLS